MRKLKMSAILLLAAVLALLFHGCDKEAEMTAIRVASLKGPTTMGMVKLISDTGKGESAHDYQFDIYGTADEIVPLLVNGEVDIALVPSNLASVLYNKTGGEVQVAAVGNLGVLSIVETGDTIKSIADLKGRTIYSTGKGTTPEYVLNYLLKENGLDPVKDVTIEYKSEATELAVLLSQSENAVAVIPEPFATVVRLQNTKVRTALDLSEEWEKASDGKSLITGVVVVRKAFLEENEQAFQDFLKEYKASTTYVNKNAEAAGVLVAEYGIVEKASVAAKAIPGCHIVYLDGKEMKLQVGAYLKVLFEANPQSIGGKLPGDDFYVQ